MYSLSDDLTEESSWMDSSRRDLPEIELVDDAANSDRSELIKEEIVRTE